MNWVLLWQIVFISVLSLFAVMSVLVTILGAFDIKKLLERLKEDDTDQAGQTVPDEPS